MTKDKQEKSETVLERHQKKDKGVATKSNAEQDPLKARPEVQSVAWLESDNKKYSSNQVSIITKMVKKRGWKMMRVLIECDKCRLCVEKMEVREHL